MIIKNKKLFIFNPQMISGSGDSVRDALGLSFEISEEGYITEPTGSTFLTNSEIEILSSGSDGLGVSYTYALRLVGDDEKIKSNKHWRSYVYGGEFDEIDYNGIYADSSFLDHRHDETIPYSVMEAKINGLYETSTPDLISLQPNMKVFLKDYHSYTMGLEDVKEIPNIYEFITQSVDLSESQINEELDYSIPNAKSELEFTQQELLENVLFSKIDIYEAIGELNTHADLVPTSNIFEMNFEETGDFVKSVAENEFGDRFIKVLKDCFLEQEGTPSLSEVQFVALTTEMNEDKQKEVTTETTELKVLDVSEMLSYSLKQYNTETENFSYLLDKSENVKSQYDDTSILRFEKTIPTIKQMRFLNNFVRSPDYLSFLDSNPIETSTKLTEVVAYRLEKIGPSITGGIRTTSTIQNFWFLNLEDVTEFKLYDNQVHYGQEYTYNLYRYVLIVGTEYSYNQLVVSRIIAELDGENGWCLEMYNPETDEATAPLYDSVSIEDSNEFASEAQIRAERKYLADIGITTKTSIKIVEVPIFSKEITILDSPTNGISIKPFYLLDNSNRIGFSNRYMDFIQTKFPTSLNSTEEEYKNSFLSSYDLLDDEEILTETTSLPIELRVYRIEEKPTSISDFADSLIASYSLKIPNEKAAYVYKTVYDKIAANRKYYYLLRFINELGSPARNSQIFETTLTDDEGYKFTNFQVLFEEELEEEVFSTPIKKFKKLFNLVPNINNFILNDSDADYSEKAEDQIDNISFGSTEKELVWDRKYKVRITSRKTGKKMDINLTFKIDG